MDGSLDGWWVRGGRWGGWLGVWADGLMVCWVHGLVFVDGWLDGLVVVW